MERLPGAPREGQRRRRGDQRGDRRVPLDPPSVQNVVLVGGDSVVPFARLDDLTTVANEAGYDNPVVGQLPRVGAPGPGRCSRTTRTRPPQPVPYFGRQLHVPDLAVGRLVETPAQIAAQVDAFATANGRPRSASTALTTGYDFLTDGALPSARRSADLTGAGTRPDLGHVGPRQSRARGHACRPGCGDPPVTSLNGHADYYGFQPAR